MTLMRPEVYVDPRERIFSLSVCLCLSFPVSLTSSLWLCLVLLKSLDRSGFGNVWERMGKGGGLCSEPFWQSTHLTQKHLGIREEAFLVRVFESQENFPGWPQQSSPFVLLGNELICFPGTPVTLTSLPVCRLLSRGGARRWRNWGLTTIHRFSPTHPQTVVCVHSSAMKPQTRFHFGEFSCSLPWREADLWLKSGRFGALGFMSYPVVGTADKMILGL